MRVLCLDGGGSKGIYTLGVLNEIERKYGSLAKLFDAVYGTSTGSIIAAGIAIGLRASEMREFYESEIPTVMKVWWKKARSETLRRALTRVFGRKGFAESQVRLGIVATNFDDRRLLLFKSSEEGAYDLKSTFVPGFGCSVADAVLGSCSAYPFFSVCEVRTQNQGAIRVIDGGYIANNPALLAYADVTKALELEAGAVRFLSLGTGNFPSRYPMYAVPQLARLALNRRLIEVQFEASAASISKLFEIYARGTKHFRVNDSYIDPALACSLFEYDRNRLARLYAKGREAFGNAERQVAEVLE